jgi:hypothetical protein
MVGRYLLRHCMKHRTMLKFTNYFAFINHLVSLDWVRDNQYSLRKVEEAAMQSIRSGMVKRVAAKARATRTRLNKTAIMAEIEASVRKKVKAYLAKQKSGSNYNHK